MWRSGNKRTITAIHLPLPERKLRKEVVMKRKFLILIAGVMVFAGMFTSCKESRTDDVAKDIANDAQQTTDTDAPLTPIGLTYYSFASDNDVEILNSDTTEISVSKELADRLGITAFKGRTMGIWQKAGQLPYIRKAVEQTLTDDRYILKVERGTIADVLGECDAEVETDMFLDRSRDVSLRAASATIDDVAGYVSKYVDGNNVIHPAAVILTDPYGYNSVVDYTDAEAPGSSLRRAADGYDFVTPEMFFADNNALKASGTFLSIDTEIDRNFKIPVSSESLTMDMKCPMAFQLNYKFTFSTFWKRKWAFIYIPQVKEFQAGVDGMVDFAPQITLGYKAKTELPCSKQTISIAKFKGYTFVFMVGAVPVSISITPSLDLVFKGEFSGSVNTLLKYEYKNNFEAGVIYRDGSGWNCYRSSTTQKNNFSFSPAKADFSAEAGVGLMLGADISIYGCGGPGISIGPNLEMKSKLTLLPSDPPYTFKGNLDFGLIGRLSAKLQLLGYNIARWDSDIQIGPSVSLWHYDSTEQGCSLDFVNL